jgi:hypothetical protein
LGVGLTASPFKRKFVENLVREKFPTRSQGSLMVVPLMIMMMMMI